MASSDYIPTSYPDFSDYGSFTDWTGNNRWNAIYTVTLGELIDKGVFDWSMDLLDWSEQAYNEEQYERVCQYFIERFRFREISIEPFYEWGAMLHRKLAYELMPKYINAYQALEDGFDVAQVSDKYHKRRAIGSDYPETLLSGNSDYISNGQDEESEDIERGNVVDSYINYLDKFIAVDTALLDELENMFIGIYTVSIDGM